MTWRENNFPWKWTRAASGVFQITWMCFPIGSGNRGQKTEAMIGIFQKRTQLSKLWGWVSGDFCGKNFANRWVSPISYLLEILTPISMHAMSSIHDIWHRHHSVWQCRGQNFQVGEIADGYISGTKRAISEDNKFWKQKLLEPPF